uniref:Uncharacterized protein C19orf44 n=1 Tax=Phallusia mammillata TaxID=59560 RepID=A0A6F9D857_9ASCI|nr:uncharacterized protein C19orf44 [Phallusia mammillata]
MLVASVFFFINEMHSNTSNRSITSPPTGISADKWLQSRKGSQTKQESKKYTFMDDSSSDDSFSASRFIKKDSKVLKTKSESAETLKKANTPSFKSVQDFRPKTSRGKDEPQVSKTLERKSALNRFAELEKQILTRHKTEKVSLSVSDLDISSDFEIRKDADEMRQERESAAAKQFAFLNSSSDSERPNAQFVKPVEKLSSIGLDSTEKTGSIKKTVSFASNLVQDSPSERSLDDFLPSQSSEDEPSSLDDVLPVSSLQNVKTLDDLYPEEDLDGSATNAFNLHTVDELSVASNNSEESASSVSEGGNLFNIHSVDELLSPIQSPKVPQSASVVKNKEKHEKPVPAPNLFHAQKTIPSTPSLFKATDVVRESVETVTEIQEYTEDFNASDNDTMKDTDSITQDIQTETELSTSSSASSITTSKSVSTAPDASYSESFESGTETADSAVIDRTRVVKRNNVSIQTDPVQVTTKHHIPEIPPSDRMIFEPSRLVSNEALASLTTYSPAVLAVQDMIRQQLAFTRDFMTRSENLHKAASESLVPDYQYASLEEARKFIQTYRAK